MGCGKLCSGMPFFVHSTRLAFGFWLAYVGATKWINGAPAFVNHIVTSFASTWAPAPLLTAMAWLILVAEPLLGVWLVVGIRPKCAWKMTALLMFLLLFGQTMTRSPNVINNWIFLVLALVCAAFTESSCCTKDGACETKGCSKGSCDSDKKPGACCG